MVAHEDLLKKLLGVLHEQGCPSTPEELKQFNCQFYKDHGIPVKNGALTSAISKFHRYVKTNKMPPFLENDPEMRKMFRETASRGNKGWRMAVNPSTTLPVTPGPVTLPVKLETIFEVKSHEQAKEEALEKDQLAEKYEHLKRTFETKENDMRKSISLLQKDLLIQTRKTEHAERDVVLLKGQLRHQEHAIRMMEAAIRDKDELIATQKLVIQSVEASSTTAAKTQPPDSPLLPPAWCWM